VTYISNKAFFISGIIKKSVPFSQGETVFKNAPEPKEL